VLISLIVVYLLISIAIGLWAARRVNNSQDYVSAGRHLGLPVVVATVFATWFGSEAVLGIPATFFTDGLGGIVEDPFGSSFCLILVGLFFARRLYRMNLLTIGDFYRIRYGRTVELITAIAIVLSYLGWVAAQITALGLVFSQLSQGVISTEWGMVLGAGIVLLYTLFGGMWSVAMTDFFQMIIIVLGLTAVAVIIGQQAGGVAPVLQHASEHGKFVFFPEPDLAAWLAFIAAAITLMFGSVPQQDVFQRVNSSRNEDIAVKGSLFGGSFYLFFAAVPIFIAYSAHLVDPALVAQSLAADPTAEGILPALIMAHTPLLLQVLFYGALLAAIMSTASGTLLAPSATFAENILKGFWKNMTDRQLLIAMRVTVVLFTICVTLFALQSEASIYEMVGNAYKVTLVTAFVPLVAGIYWKRSSTQSAMAAILCGLFVWVPMELWTPEALVPPQLAGFLAAVFGMLVGTWIWPRRQDL
jgi:SSS family solute:Na+ symporter